MRSLIALVLIAVVGASTGCQAWRPSSGPLSWIDIPSGIPWKAKRHPKGTPVRMAATWTEAVLNQAGQKSERGFGGKIFFYGKKGDKPIETQGQLVVYAFEEDGRSPTDQCPTRRYVFPPEEFVRHKSESELGLAYSFWLPWDEAGGFQKNISLIARFEPLKGGEMVVSEQTSHRLPGQIDLRTMLAQEPPKVTTGVAQVTYEQEAPAAPPTPAELTKLQTTSITLPSKLRGRASASAPGTTTMPTTGGPTTSVSLLSPVQSVRPISQQR